MTQLAGAYISHADLAINNQQTPTASMYSPSPVLLPVSPQPKRKNDVETFIRTTHWKLGIGEAYFYRIPWYIGFHDTQHLMEMGAEEPSY